MDHLTQLTVSLSLASCSSSSVLDQDVEDLNVAHMFKFVAETSFISSDSVSDF